MTNHFLTKVIAAVLLLVGLVPESSNAMPSGVISRQRRVSDQRLAELETLMALSMLKGKLVSVPIGFGRIDPTKIGRRRRSSTGTNIQDLQRILKTSSLFLESDEDGSTKKFFASSKDTDDLSGDEVNDPPLL